MSIKPQCVSIPVFLFAIALGASYSGNALADTCTGNCSSGVVTAADGVVTLPPGGGSYQWISTNGGVTGAGELSGIGGTNGTTYTTAPFTATAGSPLNYYFNYVTSDGSGYADYAWAQLTQGGTVVATLLTARTQPTGNIIPGFNLPAIDATLTPSSVPIIGGAPTWSPLGGSSGTCYAAGCGYTDWVASTFGIPSDGTYQLSFGVTNWLDTAYDSGLAFSGLTVGGIPIQPPSTVPLPAALPLFASGLGVLGLLGWRRKAKASV